MWQVFECVFGCGATHKELLASEALSYWWGGHHKMCSEFETYMERMNNAKV
jgi:hypothetical protein